MEQEQQKQPVQNNKNKKRKAWFFRIAAIFTLLILLVLLLHKMGYIRFPWDDPRVSVGIDTDNFKKGDLPTMTDEEILKEMQKQADASVVSIKINARPVFENGKSKGDLMIANPAHNVYVMQAEIHLGDGNGEIIYDSGKIPPGYYIDNDKLTKVLKKGSHEAVAYLIAYDPDTNKVVNKSSVDMIIKVKH